MERASLVAERCTTCGSLLPCDLHNREMKRVILSGEREEEPRFEKVWEGKEDALFRTDTPILWLSNRRFVAINNNLWSACSAELSEDGNEWIMKAHFLSNGRTSFISNSHTRIKSATLLNDNKILINTDGGNLYILEPKEQTAGGVFKVTDFLHQNENDFNQLVSLGDGSCLGISDVYKVGGRLRRSRLFYLHQSGSVWHSVDAFDPYNSSNGEDIEFLLPLPNGSFVVKIQSSPILSLLTHSGRDFTHDWTSSIMHYVGGTEIVDHFGALQRAISLPTGNDAQFIFGDAYLIFLYRQDSADNTLWSIESIGCSEDRSCSCMHALTADSLIVGGSEGTLQHLSRGRNGEWKTTLIAQENNLQVTMISHPPTDSSCFLVRYGDDKLSYYRIPPDKLQAHHERQGAQVKPPSLPTDL